MSIKKEVNSIVVLLVISFFYILLPRPAVQGDSSLKSISSEKHAILESIKKKHKKTHSIKASVYQEKNLMALNKPVHVQGSVILEKSGMLRWEAVTPEKSIMIINRKTITMYYPDAKEAEIRRLSDNFIAQNTMSFFSSVMWGALDEMEKRFAVDISYNNDEVIVELTPLSKMVSRYLSSVIIFYNKQNGMPQGFEVKTPKGDRTITKLADIEVDPDINSDTFKLKIPADVIVRDFTKQMDFN
ncbi:MAG TPA: outer membrane lipoprotein carrier protein LolA [bacterium]|nr:outer membrane lipoprotein carrier protein LolA [bacterium]